MKKTGFGLSIEYQSKEAFIKEFHETLKTLEDHVDIRIKIGEKSALMSAEEFLEKLGF